MGDNSKPLTGITGTTRSDIKQVCVNGHTFSIHPKYDLNGCRILGRGSYGVVTTAVDTTDGMKLAIKRIRPYANDEWDARHTLREIRLLKLLGPHPNVITLYDLSLFEEKTELYMMMEVMDCDLHHIIQSKQTLSEMHHKCFAKQMLEGIKAMHSIGVFHRDLKPGNLLVSKDCKLRITDFGLARYMDESTLAGNNSQNPMTEYVVTRWYRCPELLLAPNRPYSEAIDLWSIGCIMAELIRRKPLFPGKSHANQVQLIFEVVGFSNVSELGFSVSSEALTFLNRKCKYPRQNLSDVVPQASPEAISFINSLLCVNPRRRPTAAYALTHAYVKDAETFNDYSIRYLRPPPPGYFDFETAEHSLEQLRTLIHEEVSFAGRIGHLGPQNAANGGMGADNELTLGSMRMSGKSGKSGRVLGGRDGLDSAAPTQVKGYQANQQHMFRGESNKSMRDDNNHSYKARKASMADAVGRSGDDGRHDTRETTESKRPSFISNGAAHAAAVTAAADAVSNMNLNGHSHGQNGTSHGETDHADGDVDDLDRHEMTGSKKKNTPRKLESLSSRPLSRGGSRKDLTEQDTSAIPAPSTTGKFEPERAMQVPQQLRPLARHGSNPLMVEESRQKNGMGESDTSDDSAVVTKKRSYGLLPVAFGLGGGKDAGLNEGTNNDTGSRSGFPTISRIGSSIMGGFRGTNGRKASGDRDVESSSRQSSSKNGNADFEISYRSEQSEQSSQPPRSLRNAHSMDPVQSDFDEKTKGLIRRSHSHYDESSVTLPAVRKA